MNRYKIYFNVYPGSRNEIGHHSDYKSHGHAMEGVADILDEFPNAIVVVHSFLKKAFKQEVYVN